MTHLQYVNIGTSRRMIINSFSLKVLAINGLFLNELEGVFTGTEAGTTFTYHLH